MLRLVASPMEMSKEVYLPGEYGTVRVVLCGEMDKHESDRRLRLKRKGHVYDESGYPDMNRFTK